ncbi:MAG: Conserved putative secreted protein [Amycolatopsis sp.]|nr:Conserved putative secreted protein [Amycolatopsis sp.]
MSLSVLIGGATAAGGYFALGGVPSSDTVSNAALALPGSQTYQGQLGDPLAKGAPASSSQAPAPGSNGSTPAPGTSTSSTPTTPPSTSSPAPTTPAAPTTSSSAPAAPPAPPAPPKSTRSDSQADQVVDLVNQARADAGCAPLSVESHLTNAAQEHSDDMSARNYFSHDTPEGVSFDQRIRAAGYSQPGAENIAKGSTSAKQTMQLWMNSSGHRQNILNCSLTKIGVGVATDGWYWTQDFGY